jgi:hypothetical protein
VRCATAMRSIFIRAGLTCRGGGFFLGAFSGKGKGAKVRVRFSIGDEAEQVHVGIYLESKVLDV